MNLKYWSEKEYEVKSCEATPEELKEARDKAFLKLKKDSGDWAIRSCWNCNPSHYHFLTGKKKGFLFSCVMGCGRWYYDGIDITKQEETEISNESGNGSVRPGDVDHDGDAQA